MPAASTDSEADRRPLDPTPVIQLQVTDNSLEPEKRKLRRPKRFGQNYLQSTSFCSVSLFTDVLKDL